MTVVDKLIPAYVWFTYGFGTAQLPMSIVGYVSAVASVMILKGIEIPITILLMVMAAIISGCTILGYLLTKYGIWKRTTSYTNQNANPEIAKIHKSIQRIERHLGIPEDE